MIVSAEGQAMQVKKLLVFRKIAFMGARGVFFGVLV
jgi:hypothetical protein